MNPQEARELKNTIFQANASGRLGMAGEVPTISRLEAARNEGYEIPSNTVPLPSRGAVYEPGSPLHGATELDIKSMTTKEEDILMSRALIKKGTVINELIRSCLLDPRIEVPSLLAGDRNALMVSIRITGYGPEYTPQVKCPSCEKTQEFQVNLADLELKMLELEPENPGENRFKFVLPVSKKTISFRFLTGKEEEEIMATIENRQKKGGLNDNVITTRMLYSIVAVDGDQNQGKIAKTVEFMNARDSLALRKYIDLHEPGIDMRQQFVCSNCNHEEVIGIPMGPTFFWPKS